MISPPLKDLAWMNNIKSASIFPPKYRIGISDKSSSGLWGPKSTSSHPSKTFDYRSPQYDESLDSDCDYIGLDGRRFRFDRELYKRVEEFLDAEGLTLVDVADINRPDLRKGRRLIMLSLRECEGIVGEDGDVMIDSVRSATHSPKLINDTIGTSKLLQRRGCYSQTPIKGLLINPEESPLLKPKFSRRNSRVVKSPITEKDTPVSFRTSRRSSRRNSQFNTPAAGMKNLHFFNLGGRLSVPSKTKTVSKDCSPALPEDVKMLPVLKGAQSVHANVEYLFKMQSEF